MHGATLILGLGYFTWSTPSPCCEPARNAPVLLFSRFDRYSPETTRPLSRISGIVPGSPPNPMSALLHASHSVEPHTRALLLPSCLTCRP
jgi:hypothetical protein